MSCIPNTPTAPQLMTPSNGSDYGWVDLSNVTTNALSQYYPLSISVVQMDNLANNNNQHVIVQQVEVEETATSSANIRTAPLRIYLYNNSTPIAPTLGAVYNASTFDLVAVLDVATADYKRVSDTVHRAVSNPARYLRTSSANAPNIFFAVVVSNSATTVTYAASAAIRIKLTTQGGTSI